MTKYTAGNTLTAAELNADMKTYLENQCWNAFMLKKEILAAGRTPEAPYTLMYAETFNAKTGDNTTVDATNTGAFYNTTTKSYKYLSAATTFYIDIYATSVNQTTLSANGCNCSQIASGTWRIWANGATLEESINRVFYTLFRNATTAPNGVTTLTSLRASESTYRDKKVRWVSTYIQLEQASPDILPRH